MSWLRYLTVKPVLYWECSLWRPVGCFLWGNNVCRDSTLPWNTKYKIYFTNISIYRYTRVCTGTQISTSSTAAWPCTLSWSTPPGRWPPPRGRRFGWPPLSACPPSGAWFLRGPWKNSSSLTGSLSVSPRCLPPLCSYEGLSYRHIRMLKPILVICIISVRLNNCMYVYSYKVPLTIIIKLIFIENYTLGFVHDNYGGPWVTYVITF